MATDQWGQTYHDVPETDFGKDFPMTAYRLYAKFPGSKRFQPMDYERGVPVVNLIYATLWYGDKPDIDQMHKMNPGVQFKYKKITKA